MVRTTPAAATTMQGTMVNTVASTIPALEQTDRGKSLDCDLTRVEAQLVCGTSVEFVTAEALLARALDIADAALLARARCLMGRVEMFSGRHAAALETVTTAAEAFAALEPGLRCRYAGVHAEAYRVAGTSLLKLGRVAEALSKFEQAVRTARAAGDTGAVEFSSGVLPGWALLH